MLEIGKKIGGNGIYIYDYTSRVEIHGSEGTVYIYMMDVGVVRDEGVHRREREDEMKTGPVSY